MGKILLFIFTALVILGFINYVIWFWINKTRKWKSEDRLQLQEARRQALRDFEQSEESIEKFLSTYDQIKVKRKKITS